MQVFKQWPIYFLGRMLPAGIAFFGIALYTRLLDPASFGMYALLLSTSFLIGTTGYSWLRVAALRMIGTLEPHEEADYTATIAILFIGSTIVVVGVAGIALHFMPFVVSPRTLALTALATAASGWFELNVTIAQARLQLVRYSVLQAARALGNLGGSLLLISLGFKVDALLGGFIIGNCIAFAGLASWSPLMAGRLRGAHAKRLFLFGWPSSASSLSSLSGTFQRYALDFAGGTSVLGLFAAASDFANQTIGLLIGTAAIAGQPLSFRARDSGNPDALEEQLRSNARLIFAIGIGATAGLIALAQPLADVYLGPKFRANAGPLISLFAVATFLGGLRSSYFEQGFEIVLKMRPIAILTVLRIVEYLGLSILLIPRYGAIGAAEASLISEVLMLTVSVIWTRRLLRMPIPAWSFAKLTVAAALMVVSIQLVPNRDHLPGLIAAVIVGALSFGIACALFSLSTLRDLWVVRRFASHEVSRP